MDDELFEQYIEQAIDSLPETFAQRLDNVEFFIEDVPTQEHMSFSGGQSQMLLGLYQGIPQTKRGNYGVGMIIPDRITLFKLPLLYISRSEVQLVDNIRSTVLHEIAHHFGMNEEEIRAVETHRRSH